MKKRFEKLFYTIYKMPPAPHPPFGEAGSVQVFRASSRLYYTNLLNWFAKQFLVALAFFYFLVWTQLNIFERFLPPALVSFLEALGPLTGVFNALYTATFSVAGNFLPFIPPDSLFALFELTAMFFFLLQLPFSYTAVLIDYKMRWYIVTDRSLRIREGVVRIRELTMTYANIQNLSIQQNIFQQFLGIANLKVQTAGGASGENDDSGNSSIHVAYFKGVENAEEIRNLILSRLNQAQSDKKTAGIEQSNILATENKTPQPEATSSLILAANSLFNEAQTLKNAMAHFRHNSIILPTRYDD